MRQRQEAVARQRPPKNEEVPAKGSRKTEIEIEKGKKKASTAERKRREEAKRKYRREHGGDWGDVSKKRGTSIKNIPFRSGGVIGIRDRNRRRYDERYSAEARRKREKKREAERSHLPDAIILTGTVLASGGAADITLHNVAEADAKAREQARITELSIAEARRLAREERTVDIETTFMAGDPATSPFAHLFTPERQVIYIPNLYLGIPNINLFEMVRVTPTTVIIVRPVDTIQRWWETRADNARGAGRQDAVDALMMHPMLYAQALEEGRVWRSSIDEELRGTMGIDHYLSLNESVAGLFPWDEFQAGMAERGYRFSDEAIATTQKMSQMLTPLMIESVFLTELVNGGDGRTNMAVYNFGLQNWGSAGYSLFPALGDPRVIDSHGGSQATRYVVGPGRPVNMMAEYLPERTWSSLRLPIGFVPYETLEGEADPEEFARSMPTDPGEARGHETDRVIVMLNAMWNILYAADTPQGRAALDRIYEAGRFADTRVLALTRLSEFVGMAHNNPQEARDALVRWHARGGDMRVSLSTFSRDQHVAEYGIRMQINFPAIHNEYFGPMMAEREEQWTGRQFGAYGQAIPEER